MRWKPLPLKTAMATGPVLNHPDWQKPFEIHTDASNVGIGGVLVQLIGKVEHVVQFASRVLTKDEVKYDTVEKEALAIVWSVETFRQYVIGKKFIIRTDCQSLKWLFTQKKPGRITRWVLRLMEYDFDIIDRKGITNRPAGLALDVLTVQDIGFPTADEIRDAQAENRQVPAGEGTWRPLPCPARKTAYT